MFDLSLAVLAVLAAPLLLFYNVYSILTSYSILKSKIKKMDEVLKCKSCCKKLKLINLDWETRRYHKACWKQKQTEEACQFIMDERTTY